MSKPYKNQSNQPSLSPGEYVATVTGVSIYQVANGFNVFWELDADGIKLSKLNSVRASQGSKDQLKKDAAVFGIQVNGPSDLNENNFNSAVGKRVKIDVKESKHNPNYPIILFKELVKDQALSMDEVW